MKTLFGDKPGSIVPPQPAGDPPPTNVRFSRSTLDGLETLRAMLPGYKPTLSDAIREAVRRGLEVIQGEREAKRNQPLVRSLEPSFRPSIPSGARHIADTMTRDDVIPPMGAKPRAIVKRKVAKPAAKHTHTAKARKGGKR